MAAFTPYPICITNAAGTPISGGKLRFRIADGTTLATVYSDDDLTVPLTNPVVADSAGMLPMVYAAEGTVVDIQAFDASDVPLSNKYANGVVFIGDSTGAITRDFSPNGRFTVRGGGGHPHIEFGDNTGDDTGGDGRIGGWDDTQLDTLEVDSAATTFTGSAAFAGQVTVNDGKKLDTFVQVPATTVAATTTFDIALPEPIDGVRAWQIDIFDMVFSSNTGNLRARLSFDNGASYNSGANYMDNNASGLGYYDVAVSLEATAPRKAWLRLRIITPDSGTDATLIISEFAGLADLAGTAAFSARNCYVSGSLGRATNIRLYNSDGGTIAGVTRVLPLLGFGE